MSENQTFSSFGLHESLIRAISEMGYENPTPIQIQAIPLVLAGNDVMGAAQTGTGKTASFGLPLLERLIPTANSSMSPARHPVRALIRLRGSLPTRYTKTSRPTLNTPLYARPACLAVLISILSKMRCAAV